MIRTAAHPRSPAGLPCLAVAACLILVPGAVRAQEPAPLHLKVKPSTLGGLSEEARARQERLEDRMRRNEFLFRSICRTCSQDDRFESKAPFNPHEALRAPPSRATARPEP